MRRNPFSDDPKPTDEIMPPRTVCCPSCGSEEFDAHQNEFEIFRDCRKCGQRWSGGSMGAARPDLTAGGPPAPGVPAPDPDEDLPVEQYTGAGFRDPFKNWDTD